MPGEQLAAVHNLLERTLALAPEETEALNAEEIAAMERGTVSLDRKGGVPFEEVLAELGLTMEDLGTVESA